MAALPAAAAAAGAGTAAAAGDSKAAPAAAAAKAAGGVAPVIRKLDEAVINRIAAGEVIHRPSSALKELIENCLDAKSTKIQVVLKEGGLKLLQVQDNGHGIRPADFAILCERFTTSKIKSYDDLSRIDTFGFRGEALASITHVAHVTITSMTAADTCAYKAAYGDGKLVPLKPGDSADPKPCAGVRGTTISAEDLFFNVPVRRQALKSGTEEYARCLEVVSKYAVHYTGVSFGCKKFGAAKTDVHTLATATRVDTIRTIYGAQIARELLPLALTNDEYEFRLDGLCTNANFNIKKLTLILFINNRLVDSTAIRRAVETVYAAYLPKHTHPFVYLSLQLAPRNVDVNVHPTKKEVHFLHDDKIVEGVEQALEKALAGANASRTFYTQAVLPGATAVDLPATALGGGAAAGDAKPPRGAAAAAAAASSSAAAAVGGKRKAAAVSDDFDADSGSGAAAAAASGSRPAAKKAAGGSGSVPEHKMVRTDDRTRKLDAYLVAAPASAAAAAAASSSSAAPLPALPAGAVRRPRIAPEERLTSITKLLGDVEVATHAGLSEIFRAHTFVGCVDDTFALLQHKTKLYLVNTANVSKAFFYEQMLLQFADVARLRLSTPPSIRELVLMALDSPDGGWVEADGDKGAIAQYIADLLCSKAAMLAEYFGIEIDSAAGTLLSLPNLLDRYVPPLAYLPLFLLRLGVDVDWLSEEACFHSVCEELSNFYMIQPDLYLPTAPPPAAAAASQPQLPGAAAASSSAAPAPTAAASSSSEPSLRWVIQHVLFPQLRSAAAFHPPRRLATDTPPTVTQVAALEQLYKIFERC